MEINLEDFQPGKLVRFIPEFVEDNETGEERFVITWSDGLKARVRPENSHPDTKAGQVALLEWLIPVKQG